MKKNNLFRWLFAGFVLFAAVACGEEEKSLNITSLKADKSSNIIFGEEVVVTAVSSGSIFQWSCSGGTILGSGKAVIWVAPDSIGVYIISVNNGAGSQKTISVSVVGKKAPEPDIYSLYASKSNNIVFDEEITLTATSEGKTFQWSCNGGNIVGEGKSVKWIVPDTGGNYTVSVSNGENSTKSVELNVVGLFFDEFSDMKKPWSRSSSAKASVQSGGKILLINTATDETASLWHDFVTPIPLPYSYKTKIAITGDDWANLSNSGSVDLYFAFASPASSASPYLRYVYVRIVPKSNYWAVRYGVYDPSLNSVSYDYLEKNSYGNKVLFNSLDQFKTVAASIDAEKELKFFVDGEEVFHSSALKLLASMYNSKLELQMFRYVVQPTVSLLMDDFYFTNDGTILK